jgi:hypothetical protein
LDGPLPNGRFVIITGHSFKKSLEDAKEVIRSHKLKEKQYNSLFLKLCPVMMTKRPFGKGPSK